MVRPNKENKMLIATNIFARLYKDSENLYRVCIEDLFKAYIFADNEEQAISMFLNKEY